MARKILWLAVFILVVAIMIKRRMPSSSQGVVIDKMAALIYQWESGGANGMDPTASRAYRNNNPGNLEWAGWEHNVIGQDGPFAVYASWADGMGDLEHVLGLAFTNQSSYYNSSMTLTEFFNRYSPDGTGDNYARYVAAGLGVAPSTTLVQLGA